MALALMENLAVSGAVDEGRNVVMTAAVFLAGAMALLLGMIVLVGWHIQITAIIQLHPSLPAMKYNTALTFMLCGAGVLATLYGRRRPALLAALPAGLISGLTLIEYGLGVDLRLDQLFMRDTLEPELLYTGRMALSTAFCFLLAAGVLVALNSRIVSARYMTATAGMAATVVLALGAGGFMRYLSGLDFTYSAGDMAHMALHTALGFSALGVGLLLLSQDAGPGRRLSGAGWHPAAAGVAVMIIAFSFWTNLDSARNAYLNDTFRLEAQLARVLINTYLIDSMDALERMAKRWEVRGAMPRAEWEADALAYAEDYPAIQAIQWIDSSLHVQWVVPHTGNESVLGVDLGLNEQRRRVLAAARISHTLAMTSQVDLVQGGSGFVIYVPIFVNNDMQGYVSTSFRTADFVNRVIQADFKDNYHIRIQSGGEVIYATPGVITATEQAWQHEESIMLPGGEWRITVMPKQALLLQKMTRLPAIVLSMGIVLAILMGLTMRLNILARLRETGLQRLTAELKEAIQVGDKLQRETRLAADQFRDLLESAPDAMVISNADGVITLVNAQAEQLLGYRRDELIGNNVEKVIPGRFRDKHPDRRKQYLKEPFLRRMGAGIELFVVHKDGSEIPVEISLSPLKTETGTLVSSAIRDITERKAAEETLRKSEAHLRAVVDNLAEGVLVSDMDGQLLHFNPASIAMHGFTGSDEYLRRLPEFADTFELAALDGTVCPIEQWPLARILRGESLRDQELRVRRINSDWFRIFSYGGTLVRDADGKALLAVVMVRDITDRKRAEETLRDSEEKYRMLWEGTADTVVMLDENSMILQVNSSVQRMFGYLPEELVGRDIAILESESLRQKHHDGFKRYIESGERTVDWNGRAASALHRDGHEFPVEIAYSEMKVGGKRLFGGFIRDITQRKRDEETILSLNAELEERIKRRTAQLETANKELEAFSYSISHDLRAPIRHVSGFIDLLGDTAGATLDEKGRRYLVMIRDAAARMGVLIDDLLSFSRTGREELKLTEVNLKRLVDETVANLKPDTEGRRIEWRIADLPEAHGDPNMLRVVLVNLLSNAVKFTGRRELAEISVGALPDDGNEAVIFVRDNGAGFDMKYADKLFGVFQRLHRREEFDGTGIGLAIVSRIINRHGGRVWAESRPDAGASFYFTLPKTVN